MPNEAVQQPSTAVAWQNKQVYTMAAVCLLIGLAIGYLFRGLQSPTPAISDANQSSGAAAGMAGNMGGRMPTLEQMKQMAGKKAKPLLDKLKSDPNNSHLLTQVGNIYKATHQFKEAGEYYEKALKIDPKNVALRTEFASCLYYNGNVDEAIEQLNQSLRDNPKDANSLFNLGAIKWQGKQDAAGALAAWKELLKTNPQLSVDRKANVQKLIEEAKRHGASGTRREATFAGSLMDTKAQ
jgi:cytochrome c-type biogenesis protein CcmH/NrfG